MAITRAQSAAQKSRQHPTPKNQGKQPQGILRRKSAGRNDRHHRSDPARNRPRTSSTRSNKTSPTQPVETSSTRPVQPLPASPTETSPIETSPTRPVEPSLTRPVRASPARSIETSPKRPDERPLTQPVKDISGERATGTGAAQQVTNPIAFWAKEGRWPQEFLYRKVPIHRNLAMEYMHTRKRTESSPSINHKRTHSTTPTTPSDQKRRELKSIRYQGPHYLRRLAAKNSYAQKFKLGVTDESKRLCQALLDGTQLVPKESLFDDDIFERTCDKLEGKNEARVIQDISRLIVPSAEQLSLRAQHLECLTESVNEGWNNSIPLIGPRPQPDYSVGFGREAFSKDQLAKMSPFIGDLINGQSLFLATFDMHFPFLTCESKCGEGELEIVDR